MGKRLNTEQFVAHARRQIQAAQAIRQCHHASRLGLCTCGRPQPCPVITASQRTITHYQAKLAIIDATIPLPIIV